jgi:ribosomal protein S28E/S33
MNEGEQFQGEVVEVVGVGGQNGQVGHRAPP